MIQRLVWRVIRLLYVYLAKPILFLIPPDKTHADMIKFSVFFGKFALTRGITKFVFSKKPDNRLVQQLFCIKFTNPVGIAAGLDKNAEMAPISMRLGFGFSEVGSVTALPCAGNPKPWFYRLPKTKSLVVNAGLGNQGAQVNLQRLAECKYIKGFPVILSVAKTNCKDVVSVNQGIIDYVKTVKSAKDNKNVSMIELNISCPNAFGGEPFTAPARLEKLLKAIDKLDVNVPFTVKMPVDLPWDAFAALLRVIVAHPVIQAVTIANLFKDRSKIEFMEKLPDSVRGNMSGKPTCQTSNDLIRQTYLHYGSKLKIIGVGGVFSAEDAYEKIRLGASLVELATGMIFNGPQIAAEINYDLARLLKRDGYDNISQVVGVDVIE